MSHWAGELRFYHSGQHTQCASLSYTVQKYGRLLLLPFTDFEADVAGFWVIPCVFCIFYVFTDIASIEHRFDCSTSVSIAFSRTFMDVHRQ